MNQEIRIVLVGKKGVGKSATGNTIFGEKIFCSESRATSITKQCQYGSRIINRRHICVVDTPGLYGTQGLNDVMNEVVIHCIRFAAPGPHVFLFVMAIGRFTEEDRNIVELIHAVFGRAVLNHMMVLFTRGDDLEERTFEDYIKETPELKKVINACRGNYHVFNNREKSNRTQVDELMSKIVAIVIQNNNSFYSNHIFTMVQELNSAIRTTKEKDKIIADLIKDLTALQNLHMQQYSHSQKKNKSICNIL